MVHQADFCKVFSIHSFFLIFILLFSSLSCLLPPTLHSNAFELSCSFSQAQISVESGMNTIGKQRGEKKKRMGGLSFWVKKKMVLFSLFFFFLFLSLVYLDKGKERKVTAGQKGIEVICMQPEKLSEDFFPLSLFYTQR